MSKEKIKVQLVEKRLVVWDTKDGSELYSLGYYGKPIGIPKPKTFEFDVPTILDMIEAVYLQEKGIIEVYDEAGKRVSKRKLRERANAVYEDFDLKYLTYKDLKRKGYIVQSGIKFGCTFAVYLRGPGLDHAPFLVSVMRREDMVGATDVVRAGRLATTVKKRFILAVPNQTGRKINYLIFKWWRA